MTDNSFIKAKWISKAVSVKNVKINNDTLRQTPQNTSLRQSEINLCTRTNLQDTSYQQTSTSIINPTQPLQMAVFQNSITAQKRNEQMINRNYSSPINLNDTIATIEADDRESDDKHGDPSITDIVSLNEINLTNSSIPNIRQLLPNEINSKSPFNSIISTSPDSKCSPPKLLARESNSYKNICSSNEISMPKLLNGELSRSRNNSNTTPVCASLIEPAGLEFRNAPINNDLNNMNLNPNTPESTSFNSIQTSTTASYNNLQLPKSDSKISLHHNISLPDNIWPDLNFPFYKREEFYIEASQDSEVENTTDSNENDPIVPIPDRRITFNDAEILFQYVLSIHPTQVHILIHQEKVGIDSIYSLFEIFSQYENSLAMESILSIHKISTFTVNKLFKFMKDMYNKNFKFYLNQQEKYLKFNKKIPKVFLKWDENVPKVENIDDFEIWSCQRGNKSGVDAILASTSNAKLPVNLRKYISPEKKIINITDEERNLAGQSLCDRSKSIRAYPKAIEFPLLSEFPIDIQARMIENFEAKIYLDKLTFDKTISFNSYNKFKQAFAKSKEEQEDEQQPSPSSQPLDSGINSERTNYRDRWLNSQDFGIFDKNSQQNNNQFELPDRKKLTTNSRRIRKVNKKPGHEARRLKRSSKRSNSPDFEEIKNLSKKIKLTSMISSVGESYMTSNIGRGSISGNSKITCSDHSLGTSDFRSLSPLLIPLEVGRKSTSATIYYGKWQRTIDTYNKRVIYKHENKEITTLAGLKQVISEINNKIYLYHKKVPFLNLENFCFDSEIDTDLRTKFSGKITISKDISNGKELNKIPIPAVASQKDYNLGISSGEEIRLPNLSYTVDYRPSVEVEKIIKMGTRKEFLACCTCLDGCISNNCECLIRQREFYLKIVTEEFSNDRNFKKHSKDSKNKMIKKYSEAYGYKDGKLLGFLG